MSEGSRHDPRNPCRRRPPGARGRHLGDRPVAPVVRVHRPPPDAQGARPVPRGQRRRHHRRAARGLHPGDRDRRQLDRHQGRDPRRPHALQRLLRGRGPPDHHLPQHRRSAPATARPSGRSTATSPSRAHPPGHRRRRVPRRRHRPLGQPADRLLGRRPRGQPRGLGPELERRPGDRAGSCCPTTSAWRSRPSWSRSGQQRPRPGVELPSVRSSLMRPRPAARGSWPGRPGCAGPYQVRARPSTSSTRAPGKPAATSSASALANSYGSEAAAPARGPGRPGPPGVELGVAGGRVVQHRLAAGQPEQVGRIGPAAQPHPRVAPDRAGVADPAGGPAGRRRRRRRPGRRRAPPPRQVADGGGQVAQLGRRPRRRWSAWSRTRPARPPPGAGRPACGSPRRWPPPGPAPAPGPRPGRGSWCPGPWPAPSRAPAGSTHQSVTPTSRSPTPATTSHSVSDGTRLTTRPTRSGRATAAPRASTTWRTVSRCGGCGSRPPRSGRARTPGRPGG